ncbi:hypothetical protein BDZ94DRAFT_1287112 [Collybia nuda]|uniref:Uncharacterized protein n=1 Tax=Collybia nuda TaxID=64659 RepID=A0A9P6CJC8_9AGAR|nr:hypothetical protein BDZ94DRAFT_1287112 [Collybia nuda]
MTVSAAVLNSTPGGDVPPGTGPPTREELLAHYPAKFTWSQLKTFVNSGDLGLLKRDRMLQKRYDAWAVGINAEYGSIINYLMNYRLQWGKRDNLSLLPSTLDIGETDEPEVISTTDHKINSCHGIPRDLPALPDDTPPYFTANTQSKFISIIQNDWPYSVPPEIEHTLVWTQVPVFHEDLIDESISSRIVQDGLWGFTGNTTPPPSPSTLPTCLPALADWGITIDKLVRSEKGSVTEEELVRRAGQEVHNFVRRRWSEDEWETAWFVNPPRLQSVPGLAHIHVFASRKHT